MSPTLLPAYLSFFIPPFLYLFFPSNLCLFLSAYLFSWTCYLCICLFACLYVCSLVQVPVSQVPVFLLFIYLHLKSCLSACLSSTCLLSFGQCIRVAVHLHVIFIDCLIACLSFCFSVSLPDSLFVCLYLCIIVYVFIIFYENIFHICASLFIFVFMPVCLKGYLYLSPCDNLSVNLSVYVTICFSFCLSDCLPVYLSRCLSISLFVFSACKLVSLFVFYASVTVFLSAFFLCS